MLTRERTESGCEVTEASLELYEIGGYPSGSRVGGLLDRDLSSRPFGPGDLEVGDVYVTSSGCNIADLPVEATSTTLTPLGFAVVGMSTLLIAAAIGAAVVWGIVKLVQRFRRGDEIIDEASNEVARHGEE